LNEHRTSTSLGTGLLGSLVIHAGLATGLVVYGNQLGIGAASRDVQGVVIPLADLPQDKAKDAPDSPKPPRENEVKPPEPVRVVPPEFDPQEVKLGIEDGVAETETWLGYREATRHVATPANVDQAAFSLATGAIAPEQRVGGEDEVPQDARPGRLPTGTAQPAASTAAVNPTASNAQEITEAAAEVPAQPAPVEPPPLLELVDPKPEAVGGDRGTQPTDLIDDVPLAEKPPTDPVKDASSSGVMDSKQDAEIKTAKPAPASTVQPAPVTAPTSDAATRAKPVEGKGEEPAKEEGKVGEADADVKNAEVITKVVPEPKKVEEKIDERPEAKETTAPAHVEEGTAREGKTEGELSKNDVPEDADGTVPDAPGDAKESTGPRPDEKAVEALSRVEEGKNKDDASADSTASDLATDATSDTTPDQKSSKESQAQQPNQKPNQPQNQQQKQTNNAVPGRDGVPGSAPKVTGTRAGASGRPGEKSDQSSDPTSLLREAIDVVPGRPAAAKGLKIKTTPPQWSITTMLVRGARNPVIAITFGKSGKVIKAEFLRGMDAGSAEVNGPLIDAIHEWRAEGERLKRLPDTKDAGVTIVMRITLRGV
jgi:hypothetical protein